MTEDHGTFKIKILMAPMDWIANSEILGIYEKEDGFDQWDFIIPLDHTMKDNCVLYTGLIGSKSISASLLV